MFGLEKIKRNEEEIKVIDRRLDTCIKELESLRRVILYSRDDRPTFHISSHTIYSGPITKINHYVYLYINKNEYKIWLREHSGTYTDRKTFIYDKYFKLDVKGDLAYLIYDDTNIIERYIIDYRKGTYVMESIVFDESKKGKTNA